MQTGLPNAQLLRAGYILESARSTIEKTPEEHTDLFFLALGGFSEAKKYCKEVEAVTHPDSKVLYDLCCLRSQMVEYLQYCQARLQAAKNRLPKEGHQLREDELDAHLREVDTALSTASSEAAKIFRRTRNLLSENQLRRFDSDPTLAPLRERVGPLDYPKIVSNWLG
jgi:hypothetical protein